MPAPGVRLLPLPVGNLDGPKATVVVDPITGAVGAANPANYTAINTSGTATITTGRPNAGGVFHGLNCVTQGTNTSTTTATMTAQAFDIVVTGTATASNALTAPVTNITGSTAAGQTINPGPSGVGVRFVGTLEVVVAVSGGSMGAYNALWD